MNESNLKGSKSCFVRDRAERKVTVPDLQRERLHCKFVHLYQLFNMDYRQARSCNRSLFPQSGIAGQETKASFSEASHRMKLAHEYLAGGVRQTAGSTAIPLPSGLAFAFSV